MKTLIVTLILGCGMVAALSHDAMAQASRTDRQGLVVADSTQIQQIRLKDGGDWIGRIVAIRGDTVDIETSATKITMPRSAIRSVTTGPISDLRNGEYWFPNPNTSRLFFAPTGQMLKKGEGYASAHQLFFVGGAYGISDNITIGGGTFLILPGSLYFLTPKIGFSPGENLHLAAGAMVIGARESETFGVYYAVATAGSKDATLTTGLGYGFAGSDVARKPVVMIGGEKRVSRRLALVSENYFIPDIDPMISFGFRFLGEKMSADLGVMRVADSGESITLPLVNFVFKF